MILLMDSKTFLNKFIHKEKKSTVMNVDYLIASSRIRVGNLYREQVTSIYNLVYPEYIVVDALDESEDEFIRWEYFKEAYFNMLRKPGNLYYLSLIACEDYLKSRDEISTVILTTPIENKTFDLLRYLKQFMWEELKCEVFMYPDLTRKHKCTIDDFAFYPYKKIHEIKMDEMRIAFANRDGRINFFKDFLKKDFKGARKFVIKKLSKRTEFSKKELKEMTVSELSLLAANNLDKWKMFFDWTFYDPDEYDD